MATLTTETRIVVNLSDTNVTIWGSEKFVKNLEYQLLFLTHKLDGVNKTVYKRTRIVVDSFDASMFRECLMVSLVAYHLSLNFDHTAPTKFFLMEPEDHLGMINGYDYEVEDGLTSESAMSGMSLEEFEALYIKCLLMKSNLMLNRMGEKLEDSRWAIKGLSYAKQRWFDSREDYRALLFISADKVMITRDMWLKWTHRCLDIVEELRKFYLEVKEMNDNILFDLRKSMRSFYAKLKPDLELVESGELSVLDWALRFAALEGQVVKSQGDRRDSLNREKRLAEAGEQLRNELTLIAPNHKRAVVEVSEDFCESEDDAEADEENES